MNKQWVTSIVAASVLLSTTASAATTAIGAGVRVSTFGFGADIDVGLSKWATFRIGYHGLNYGKQITDTNVSYDGKLTISAVSAIVDWNLFAGGFHVSLGAVSNGPRIDVVGTPTNGTYTFNGVTYQASEIGSLTGTIKLGKSVVPYIGLGWGNAASNQHSVTFLVDVGAIHTGTAAAAINVSCSAGVPTTACAQITADANVEKTDLEKKMRSYQWYPVVGIGFGVKF